MMYKKGGCHPKLFCGSVNVGAAGEIVRLIFVILNIQVHTLRLVTMLSEICMSLKCCKNVPCHFTYLKHAALIPEGHGGP